MRSKRTRLLAFALGVFCSALTATVSSESQHPPHIQVELDSAVADSIRTVSQWTVEQFESWFRPCEATELIVVDDGPLDRLEHQATKVIAVLPRWLTPDHDGSLERSLIAAIVRACTGEPSDQRVDDFDQGFVRYATVRLINARGVRQSIDSRPRHTERFFGAFVPYVVRSLTLTRAARDPRPPITEFSELPRVSDAAQRISLALLSLERYLGWPVLQAALATLLATDREPAPLERLAALLSMQQGNDVRWFFADAPRRWQGVDYGIVSFTTEPANATSTAFITRLRAQQLGEFVFASRGMSVVIAFADGRRLSEWWDGRESRFEREYVSVAPGIGASIDPDTSLLLDRDRSNNAVVLQPTLPPYASRRILSWAIWLQNLLLTAVALT